jgi:hypothetical protein
MGTDMLNEPRPCAPRTEFISVTIDEAVEACAGATPGAAAATVKQAMANTRFPCIEVPRSTFDLFHEAYEVS